VTASVTHRLRWDVAIAAAFAVCVLLGSFVAARVQHQHVRPIDVYGVLLILTASFGTGVLRRFAPNLALAGAVVLVNLYLLLGYPFGPVLLCLVVAMFEVARQRSLRLSALACGAAAVLTALVMLIRVRGYVEQPTLLAAAWTVWLILPWSLGALVNVASAARRDLIERVALEERMKIAAEVHDVAGHGFALIAMQAGVALLVFDEKRDQARESLRAIQTVSSRSLTDLRAMLDVIHPSAAGPVAGESSHAGIAALVQLVDEVRASGLRVRLTVRLDSTMDSEVYAVLYRVLQESLTNVLRHAGATRAEVDIVQHEGEVTVRVVDEGNGSLTAEQPGGRGLPGMRSRVEAVGGRFKAAVRDEGGFRVEASIPLGRGAQWSA
jgi:signal transduction histidine kinase